MTEETLRTANSILVKIKDIKKLEELIRINPCIKGNSDDYEKFYLSWADNDNSDLKHIIIKWCDDEIEKLEEQFKAL